MDASKQMFSNLALLIVTLLSLPIDLGLYEWMLAKHTHLCVSRCVTVSVRILHFEEEARIAQKRRG